MKSNRHIMDTVLSRGHLKTGKLIRDLKAEIKAEWWPNSSTTTQNANYTNLLNGKTNLTSEKIQFLHKKTGTPYNEFYS